jgi:hypothetical protein
MHKLLVSVAFLLFVACSGASSSSPSSTANGASCSSAATCSGGLCAQSQDFPSGYCTEACTLSDPASCPTGSVCIDDASGVPADAGVSSICYQACGSDADCTRPGYKCLEKANHLVCRNGG